MPNHIHLLLRTGEIRLQKILKSIHTRFALFRNYKRKLPGPIFQGRPKSILIVGDEHLKTVARYILRNPVKAGIVKGLSEYRWSSYRNLAKLEHPEWYDNSVILEEFSSDRLTAIKEYKEFIRKPLKSDDEEYPLERFNKIAAGTKSLYEKLLVNLSKEKRIEGKSFTRKINWLKRIDTFLNKNKVSIGSLQNNSSISAIRAKKEISYVLKVLCQKESYEIIDYLKISQSTLSRYVREMKIKVKQGKTKVEDILKDE